MRIARDLATALEQAPAAVLLYGDLGAGKTAFVRGLVEGAGGCPDEVSSPTFVLMQEYPGRRLVHHVDLYRLGGDDVADLEPLLDEMLAGDAIVAIEWADRLRSLPEATVRGAHCRPGRRRPRDHGGRTGATVTRRPNAPHCDGFGGAIRSGSSALPS